MAIVWGQRCTATSRRTGQPCGQWAIKGGYVCWHHGGATRRVRAAANRRYVEAVAAEPVMKRMLARMNQGQAEAEAIRRAAG